MTLTVIVLAFVRYQHDGQKRMQVASAVLAEESIHWIDDTEDATPEILARLLDGRELTIFGFRPFLRCNSGTLEINGGVPESPAKQEKIRAAWDALPITKIINDVHTCLLYTSPSPRDATLSRMPSSA